MWRSLTLIMLSNCTRAPTPSGEIVAADVNVTGLALDATNLYWTTSDGAVVKLALDGSHDPIELVSEIQTRPSSIAVDSEFVYWTNVGSLTSATDGAVMKVPIAGGAPTTLATGYAADAIAVTADAVFWGDDSTLRSIPKDGGPIATTFHDPGFLSGVSAIAADLAFIYWNDNGPQRQALVGGSTTGWASAGILGPGSIAVAASAIYWTVGPIPCDVWPCDSRHQGYLLTASLLGGSATRLAEFTTPSYPVTPMTVDSASVYWMTADSVQRMALEGGPSETVASGQGDPHALVVGDTEVYWASGPVGSSPAAIRATPK